MKKLLFLLAFFSFASSGFSQIAVENAESNNNGLGAAKGTFEFIFRDRVTEVPVQLTSDELLKLENLRSQDNILYVRYSENVVIKLLSANYVNSPQFNSNDHLQNLYYNEINLEDFAGVDIFKESTILK